MIKTFMRLPWDTLLDIEIFQFSDVSKTAEQLIQLTGSALSSGVQRTGSANADNLKGSVLADTLLGLAGNDTLSHPLTHIVLQQLTSETHPLNAHSNVT